MDAAEFLEDLRRGQPRLTPIHEAGHGVAAVLRGGSFHGVTFERTMMRDGGIYVDGVHGHHDFVTYAGPWAEARDQWPAGLSIVDGVDSHGRTFGQYVEDALLSNASDLRSYEPDIDIVGEHFAHDAGISDGEPPPVPGPRDPSWHGELERCWPVMQFVAAEWMRGVDVTPEAVRELLVDISTNKG